MLNTGDDDEFPHAHNIMRIPYEGNSDEDSASDIDAEFDDQEEFDCWFDSNHKNYKEGVKNSKKYNLISPWLATVRYKGKLENRLGFQIK